MKAKGSLTSIPWIEAEKCLRTGRERFAVGIGSESYNIGKIGFAYHEERVNP